MRSLTALLLALMVPAIFATDYPLGPDSRRQPGVPEGKLEKHTWTSAIFPGTVRDYWVYVPAQYDGSEPAAVMVFQDGGWMSETEGDEAWLTPVVLDNLIHKGEMPVTIGIFINPGVLPAGNQDQRERLNRSFEYDALGDRYVRFVIEEILPEVGMAYKLTDDPNLRGIGGACSGAIAAFTAAWERPDAFRRVLSFTGSFVNLRGGQIYPTLIRKTEPKPIRAYLQDGSEDLDIYAGSWWLANQDMAAAFEFAGYDAKFVAGDGGHDRIHARSVMPDALRWLWRDWNEPIEAPTTVGDQQWVTQMLDPEHGWELVSEGHGFTEGPAIAPNGDFYFTDVSESKIWKVMPDGQKAVFKEGAERASGLIFGPDGRLYGCHFDKRIVVYSTDGTEEVIAEDAHCNDLVVTARGDLYYTDFLNSKVFLIRDGGEPRLVHEGAAQPQDIPKGIFRPNGITVSPDQSLLIVADWGSKWTWSFQIEQDGSLAYGQPFYRLETPDSSGLSFADGMTLAADGHLLVASAAGLQVCDQLGRVVGIIAKPQPGPLANVIFAGPDLDTLYVTAGDNVFRRKVRMTGVLPWKPVTPPAGSL